MGSTTHARDDETFTYNCYDCVVTHEISTKTEKELEERGMKDFFKNHVMRGNEAVLRMGHRGILIDEKLREAYKMDCKRNMAKHLVVLRDAIRPSFNPGSSKQVGELIYDIWDLKKIKDPQTGNPTTNDDALREHARRYPEHEEILRHIIEYRSEDTILGGFLSMKLKNGRAYTGYQMAGTVSSRLSSRATIEGIGTNLQNVQRGEKRRIFRADPGCVLIKADLSQAEYRYLIWRARIARVIEQWAIDPNWSIHWWNAVNNIWHKPREEITKEEYSKTKNGTYGANYGIGARKVSKMYDMEYDEAHKIIENYHKGVPEIKNIFQYEIREALRSSRTLDNPLGRQRQFHGRMDDQTFRAAYSWVCQSTVADLIIKALIDLDEQGAEILLQVHDELVVQCPEKDADEWCERVRNAMEIPVQVPGVDEPMIIPAEVQVGPNWYDVEEVAA